MAYTVDVGQAECVDDAIASDYPAHVAAAVDNNPRRWYEVSVSRDDYDRGRSLFGSRDDPVLDQLSGMDMNDLRRTVGDAFDGPIGFNCYRPFQQEADDAWYERDAFFYCSGDLEPTEIRDVFQEAVDEIAASL